MKERVPAGRIAAYGLLLALSLVLSYVEMLIPFTFGIPGAKLGLANLTTMTALYALGGRQALWIGLLRILLWGFTFGSPFTMLYSVCGFGLSLAGMVLLKKTGAFGITGVSAAGGVLHNLGQLICAAVLVKSPYVFTYFPALFVAGTAAGILIGLLGGQLVKRLQRPMQRLMDRSRIS